ncbi:hypothetical protein HJC04_29795 [Rhizobium sp. NLR8a]|nr:hypothetical protein [Rhizobium sp. NLR8a]
MTKHFAATAAFVLLSSTVTASATDIGATFESACPFGDCAAGISLSYLGEFVISTGHMENGVDATDISAIASLANSAQRVVPARKSQVLDLRAIGLVPDNIEAMSLGKAKDGTDVPILGSDNNFSTHQKTQFYAFKVLSRLRQKDAASDGRTVMLYIGFRGADLETAGFMAHNQSTRIRRGARGCVQPSENQS